MGQLTAADIISEALLKAGKQPSSLSDRGLVWLNARDRGLNKGWAWPWLQRRADATALATGTTSLSIGAGSGGITEEIKLIRSPILVYTSSFNARQYAVIEQLHGLMEDVGIDTVAQRGLPGRFKIQADSSVWGRWNIRPQPVPDRAFLLAFDYQIIPTPITNTALKPMYPNDRTLIAGVMADALIYMYGIDSSEAIAAEEEFSALAARDRAEFGAVPGINDQLSLDSSIFR